MVICCGVEIKFRCFEGSLVIAVEFCCVLSRIGTCVLCFCLQRLCSVLLS